jgi:transposase
MKQNTEMRYSERDMRALKERVAELEQLVSLYKEQITLLTKDKYGASSEKSKYNHLDGQISMGEVFNEAECIADEDDAQTQKTSVSAHSRKKRTHKEMLPDDVPVEEIRHELPAEERVCPECGGEMHEFGHESRDEVVIIPASIKIRRHITCTYGCRNCEKQSDHVPIKKSKAPEPVIKGSFASPEAIAHTAVQKFVMGSPLYRQEQEWSRKGVLITRQTTSNWLITSSECYFRPIWEEMKADLIAGDVLHADETTIQVLREPGKKPQTKSYMWQYRTGSDADAPIVVYDYQRDRRAIRPETFLRGFSGYLHTDGYAGYHNLPQGITVVGCFGHARRKWDEALKTVPEDKRAASPEAKGKGYIDDLFRLEREYADMSPEVRKNARMEKSKPLMDEYKEWIKTVPATPASLRGKAIGYSMTQWKYLENVLLDGRLELSNNRAERSIKPFVISRKNFLFANTPRGAEASAVIFSLIETAKETGIDPFEYLTYVLSCAPRSDMEDKAQVRSLLPASFRDLHRA